MSEVNLLVFVEAGQLRSLATAAFRLPLPNTLIWGPSAIPRIEAQCEQVAAWPPLDRIDSIAIVNRDRQEIVLAGASDTFQTPYQLMLFARMLGGVWEGMAVRSAMLTSESLRAAIGGEPPSTDSQLPRQLLEAAVGPSHSSDEDDDAELHGDRTASDFRQLSGQDSSAVAGEGRPDFAEPQPGDPAQAGDDAAVPDDESEWWVSVRFAEETEFRHYLGSFVWQTLATAGPGMLESLQELPTTEIPPEDETWQGIVLDEVDRALWYWAHPRGVAAEFGGAPAAQEAGTRPGWQAWSEWRVEAWSDNGFRRQAEHVAGHFIPASDTEVLAELIPQLVEQPDLAQAIGEIRSGVRRFVRRGFGCLALVLAVPATLAWLVSGSWQGPFAFAAGLWIMAYVGYRIVAHKIKRSFSPLSQPTFHQDAILPKLGPESEEERIAVISGALRSARLPSYEQITTFAELRDHEE